MQKIKIAQIITRLDKGGSTNIVLDIASHIDKKIYEIKLISGRTLNPPIDLEKFMAQTQVEILFINQLQRQPHIIKDIVALIRLYRLIRRERFQIVHTHTSKAGILGRFAAYFAGVAVIIYTTHGHIFRDAFYLGSFKVKIYTFLEKIAALFTDKIIVLSECERQDHLKFKVAKPDRLVVIHSGLTLDKFLNVHIDVSRKKKELKLPPEFFIVGTVGLLIPRKGHRYLIEAVPLILEAIKDVIFLIVGDGDLRTELENLTKMMGVERNVIFTGWRQEIPEILGILDLFVFPSVSEGLGLALVEAMAMKKPVVATNVGGISEVVKDNVTGLLIPPKEPRALAKAIIDILTDKQRAKEMGEAGRDYVYPAFSQEVMTDKLNCLYKALIREKISLGN